MLEKANERLRSGKPSTRKHILNLGFFMDRMASAARAKLLDGEFFGLPLLIFAGDVVAPLTAVAL